MGNTRRLTGTTSSTGIRHHRLMEETQRWLDGIVIGQKLCPFAPPVRSAPQLRMVVPVATTTSSGDGLDELLGQISAETDLLVEGLLNQQNSVGEHGGDDHDQGKNNADDYEYPETTLIILDTDVYPSLGREYRNFVQLSWRIQMECIVDRGHSDHLQLVLFHPLAVHDTYMERPPADDGDEEQVEDCADYTIRSPHPTVHLLRQADVMRAVQSGYADLEGLPSRNKARLRRDGIEVCRKRLEACSVK